MIGQWSNHLWQSTLFVAAVALTTLAFRKNRAQVRYCLWLSASVKFLVPFALLTNLGNWLWSAFAARKIATELPLPAVSLSLPPAVSLNLEQITQPFPDTSSFVPSAQPTHSTDWIPIAILCVWVCGFLSVVLVRFRAWLLVRAVLRASVPIGIDAGVAVRSSSGLREPGVVGFLRPVLLLPEDILKHLSPSQLEAVLAHELSHIRRRDNLTAAVHMVVEAIFWFHPLVWWIGARLVEERERACDETVLSLGGEPRDYAAAILSVCKLYVESPLACVSGISGADLKKRIVRIMTEGLGYKLSLGRKLLLAGVAAFALAVPVMMGQAEAAQRLMQAAIKVAPKPLNTAAHAVIAEEEALSTGEIAQDALPQDLPGLAQLRSDLVSGPRFEAAHVDRNKRVPIPVQSGPTRGGDRYVVYALSMQALISHAYDVPENQVIGGPSWLEFDRYDIEAKTPATTSDADVKLMLKALLEERFHLTVRNGTFQQPARLLYLEKEGSKLKVSDGKGEAGCKRPQAPSGPPKWILDCHNQTIEDISKMLQDIAGWRDKRPVVDRTGLKGSFDFKLSWTPDEALAMAGPGAVPLAEALSSELGLKIENGTAPWKGLLVERADEEPAPDPPDTAKIMPPRPLPQFDVSVIKPFDAGSQGRGMIDTRNGHIDVNGIRLRDLISMAWDLNNTIPIVNAPASLDTRWYVETKVLRDQSQANGNNPSPIDPQQFELMLRALLEDRFHLQAHMEDREGDAYDLVAVNPKLTPSDPNLPLYDRGRRETCAGAPAPGTIDPRIKNPALDKVQYCTNVTMEHLARQILAIGAPVRDKTGLTGHYDYTLSFTSGANLRSNGNGLPSGDANSSPSASEPNGMAIPLPEALRGELGLKLVKVRAPVPVLVIDHVEQPTPN
jgi:bla regulator protein BlaR1